ncbi:cation transporter [Nocardia nova]|jgi:predicted Co/Zn/Cd cation transporter (cation efflux family)|uniref:cation transporter n=1 Tax=Nocardia nova TaxID=37330 RepID=UPI001894978D|nr:cation transporter [Nocardia nova]MBF6149123.1 cation transporter [Nocardia nova]
MRALVFSMWASVVFVVVSLAWGLAAGSQMIVFDGLYSLVGIALSAVSVAAQRTVAKGADASYPWGRETWEPVVIVVRSTALGGLCVYGSVNAVREILHGCRAVSAVSALAYAITASLLSVLVALVLWRAARSGPGLVRAEAAEWGGDAAFSLVTLAGFGAAVALESAGRDDIARYVDPTLVIIVSLAYLWIPIRLFRSAFREILTMAAPRSVVTDVERLCDRVRTTHGFAESFVRASTVGSRLDLELAFVLGPRNAPSNPSTPSAPISTPSSTPGTTTTRRRWCSPRIATGWSWAVT